MATQRVQFQPYSQQPLNIRDLLDSGTAPGTVAGSIIVTQSSALSGRVIVGTVAMTRLASLSPSYVDEEPNVPNASGSQTLRGVADSGNGSPAVAIASLTNVPQHVIVTCLTAGAPPASKTLTLSPSQTLLTPACTSDVTQGLDFDGYLANLTATPHGPLGISLVTDAAPGSFLAFGLAPHRSGAQQYFSSVLFTDPGGAASTTTVFAGVPVGQSPLLPAGAFTPVLSLANFSQTPRHVTVQYATTQNGTPASTTVSTLTLAPLASQQLVLGGLTGDPTLQNSFLVQSDGNPGDVGAKLVSTSDSALAEVELEGKDLDASINGGDHPWNVENGNQSTLLLFNTSTDPQYFNVEISAGSAQWRKAYLLQPMQTQSIGINELIRTGAKDDNGIALPDNIGSGQVAWHMPAKNAGRGRLLVSNLDTAMARNFSCGYVAELCEAIFSGDVDFVVDGQSVPFGQIN